ncbi:MAG: DNRLRE domain-containing protein [Blastocatellales bacterium]|nr:DNRLRE domain-containing protein [Blastocatellales bacterium]
MTMHRRRRRIRRQVRHDISILALLSLVVLLVFAGSEDAPLMRRFSSSGLQAAGLNLTELRQLPEVGYHPDGINYYGVPYFSNALVGGRWIEYTDSTWGEDVLVHENPQFDANGYPKYLNAGKKLRALVWPLHADYQGRPGNWPKRSGLAAGRWLVTWQGEADIRLNTGAFVAGLSSGAATGMLVNGRRFYDIPASNTPGWIEIHSINTNQPVTDVKVWLPNPDNALQPLEGQTFHPAFLARLADRDWGHIRFMAWAATNASPERDWTDRRRPSHVFQTGVLNRRSPAPDSVWYYDNGQPVMMPGDRGTGAAWEHMIALCNATGRNLWLNIPHMTVESADQYLNKLAKLIAYGSDGVNPYDGPTQNPVYAPLNSNLKVFVEYSNEIWAGNYEFPQGLWALNRAEALGLTQQQFNARQFSRVWGEIESVLGQARVVRVAAVFTGLEFYTRAFIDEFYNNPTLLKPELMAVTTYFSNNIQYWAKANIARMEGKSHNDPYWQGSLELQADINSTFDRWTKYILSETAYEAAAGRDTVDVSGGIPSYIGSISTERNLPIAAYEGGPSIYTNDATLDGSGSADDDEITMFMEAMNRHPRFAEVYRLHLEFARWRRLWSHMMFTDAAGWGRYGQWGHLEALDQSLASAPKYQFLLDWANEHQAIRHPDDPAGAAPGFVTSATLPTALSGVAYDATIQAAGGNGALEWKLIAAVLPEGISYDAATRRLTGTAVTSTEETGYIFLRVTDADGDPAWRLFTLTALNPSNGIELDPTDDASLLLWDANSTRGGDAVLWTAGHASFGWGAYTYFKFDLGSLAALPVASAELRFQVTAYGDNAGGASPPRLIAYATTDAWSEATLKGSNSPPIGAAVSQAVAITAPSAYSLNLTSYVPSAVSAGDTQVSFVIQNDPGAYSNTNIASKEHWESAYRPKLRLTFNTSGGNPTPTPTPTPTPSPTPTPTPTPVSVTSTLNATADAYVRSGKPAANYSAEAELHARLTNKAGDNDTRETWLKFDLSALGGEATDVKLRMFGRVESSAAASVAVAAHAAANTSWTENGIKWNNRPASGAAALFVVNATQAAGYLEWDVTSYVRSEISAGRNVITLVLRGPSLSSQYVAFGSRESANKPQLVVVRMQ